MQSCCFWVGAEQHQQARPASAPEALSASTTPPREKSPAREEPTAGEISPARRESPARDAANDPPAAGDAATDPATGNPFCTKNFPFSSCDLLCRTSG